MTPFGGDQCSGEKDTCWNVGGQDDCQSGFLCCYDGCTKTCYDTANQKFLRLPGSRLEGGRMRISLAKILRCIFYYSIILISWCAIYYLKILIQEADPQSLRLVIIVFTHVRPFVPAFQNKFQVKTMITTGEIVGLVEWIIDDTFL